MISNERLEMISKYDTFVSFGESEEMARELLALRKAFSEPFCFTDDAGIDLWDIGESFEVWPEQDGDINIPLYRKPPTE